MTNRPYSMTTLSGGYAAIVKWNGSRLDIVNMYRINGRNDELARHKVAELNAAHERKVSTK